MSQILSQDTYASFGVPLTGLGGGGSAVSTFDNLFVTSTLTALDIAAFNISTTYLEADNAVISSLSTLGIYLDGALLTTAGGSELLLNGIPVATTSNISSLSDWSLDPAISTLNMNGNNIIDTADISSLTAHIGGLSTSTTYASTLVAETSYALAANVSTIYVLNQITADSGNFSTVYTPVINDVLEINGASLLTGGGNLGIFGLSTINGEPYTNNASSFFTSSITAQTGVISSLVCQDISTVTLTAFSTIHAVSSISSVTLDANSLAVSSIKSQGTPTSDLTLDGTARYLNMYSQGMSNVVDRGADVGGNAFYRLTTQNGNAGEISLVAEPGFLGNYGRIGLTANGGELAGVGLGGLIELTATTPLISLCNASSAIKFSAAGINSYAGAVPSVGSLAGYNFVYGTLGVNLTAGLPPGALPNTPGTVYMYGANGVVTGSPFYAYEVLGYWNGLTSPSNLRITGRQTIAGNSQVVVSNVDSIFFDSGYGALSGVSSINGSSYPPTFSVPSDLVVSSLTSAGTVSGPVGTFFELNSISSINGSSYPPTYTPPEDLVVSSLTSATFVSTPELTVSSINGQEYVPGSVSPDLEVSTLTAADYVSTLALGGISSIFGSDLAITANNVKILGVGVSLLDPGGSGFQVVGTGLCKIGGAGGTEIQGNLSVSTLTDVSSINGISFPFLPEQELVVSSLTSATFVSTPELTVSSINGQEYVPGSVAPDLVVSSLTSATFVSTPELFISSINGQEYLPGGVPANLDVSTLTAATFVSTPEMTVSSINGQSFSNNLTLSSLTVANMMTANTLIVNTISTVNLIDFGGFTRIQQVAGNLNLTNVASIGPPPDTDLFINQDAPGRLLLGGRNGEVSLNIGIRISTTGTVMQFVPVAGNNVGQITGLDSINGIPITSLNSPNLSISTLTAANYVSTPELTVSSINGFSFSTGFVGPTGPTGPTGAAGQSTSYFPYQADSGTTPTSGHITWSDFTVQTDSTYIRVDHIDQNSVDIDIFLNLVKEGSQIVIQDANVSGNFQTWIVSGTPIPNTGSGYVEYPITLASSGGTSNFPNNHDIILALLTTGPQGPQGDTGPTGPTGEVSPDLVVSTLTAAVGIVLESAGTITLNSTPGAEGEVIAIVGGYPSWSAPPAPEIPGDISVSTITVASGIVLDSAGTFSLNGATGAETEVITIVGGYPSWAELPLPYELPGDITVSSISGVSSIQADPTQEFNLLQASTFALNISSVQDININAGGGISGAQANVTNAGTITFDTAGAAALVNLSTINGTSWDYILSTLQGLSPP